MLVDLRVKNFALINELEINFEEGLNVMTGETGAGKSIIIGAMEILLGARASTDIIRSGTERAYIEAVFEPSKIVEINKHLDQVGIEADPKVVLLSREVRRNGRNRSRINGQLATVGMIKEISKYLVDIHGQHEHQLLLDSSSQLQLLDEFIAYEEYGMRKQVQEDYKRLNEIENKLSEIEIDEAEKARQMDMLEFQIDEIETANLKPNEIKELDKEYKLLTNIEDIYATIGNLQDNVNSEDYNTEGILDKMGNYMKELETIKDFDSRLDDFYNIVKDIYYKLEDLSYQLNDYHDNLEFDQARLDKIEERISLITTLQRKYGQTAEEILDYKIKLENNLNELKSQDKMIESLKEEQKELREDYYIVAKKLSNLRQEKAKEFENLIAKELQELAMEKAEFKIEFEEKEPGLNGIDKIEFMITTNPGEELKPLAKIASGGELSRIMLALKTIIAHIDQVDTMIFDEVDSGVGGKTAQKMAEKLALIAKRRQVMCITHLPQIASMGDNHYFINKQNDEDKTFTKIVLLDEKGKKNELARMLGGVETTETTMKHAQEMIDMAKDKKVNL